MINKLLIASLHKNEAITNAVLSQKSIFNNVDILFVNQICEELDIFDSLDDCGAKIRWSINDKFFVTNESHMLLNRVTFIPNYLVDSFDEVDRNYAKREIEAYLGFALNAFKGLDNNIPNGACQNMLSLPQQWSLACSKTDIEVPDFYWGLRDRCEMKGSLIFSSIYDYYNWKVDSSLPQKTEHIFCFKKPKGVPVFACQIGQEVHIRSEFDLSYQIKEKLIQINKIIVKSLNYFISESLYFIENGKIVFGCINTEIRSTNKKDGLNQFIGQNLIKEFYQCVN